MADTTTTFDPALKQIYRSKRVADLTYKDHPLTAMMPKHEDFGGRNYPLVTKFGNGQGRSAVFATAQTNASQILVEDFVLTRVSNYAVANLTGELALAAKGDRATFLDALTAVIDGAFMALGRDLAIDAYTNFGGARGVVGSESTTTLTLATLADIVNFEVNMEIESSETDGTSGALQAGTATVTGIDRNAGTLTSDSNWTTQIATLDAGDFLFVEGDFGVKMSGLDSWVPTSAPGATAFFGVDRTQDTTRLGGVRHTASGQSIEEALIETCSKIAREGGNPNVAYMNHEDHRDLIMLLGSKSTYERVTVKPSGGTTADFGFRATRIDTPAGYVDVIPDNACPQGQGYVLQMDTWGLYSLGPAPRLLDLDGNRILRQSSADGYEVRVGYYGQVGCDAPGYNGVVTF